MKTTPGFFVRSYAAQLALAFAVLFITGCLSRPPLIKESFAFPIPSAVETPTNSATSVLEIRQVRVAAPFDNQSFIYRTGPYSYERDPYAGFLASPADSLRTALRAEMKSGGVFKEVIPRGSGIQPDTIAEIYISGLYGDFENKSSPAAVLQMSFTLFDSRNGLPGTVLLQKEFTQRVPLQQRTAAALMAGWDEALKRIISELTGDLKAAKS